MSEAGNAWAFSFPGGGGPHNGVYLTPDGGVSLCTGASEIRQSIMMILSTIPGERVMRPEYGCELDKVLFLPNDLSTAGLVKHYITKALSRWETRVTITDIDVTADRELGERMTVRIAYEIKESKVADEVGFGVDLMGKE
jgi:Phage baseplate assembly protein W